MDIHRKLEQRRRRAGQVRQQRLLAQQPRPKGAVTETVGRRVGTPNAGSSTHD